MGFIDDTFNTNIFGDNATDRAIDAQTNAADQASRTMRDMYMQQREDNEPWRQAGITALSQLTDPNLAQNITLDPGYQFRLQEGQKAIDAAASSRGMRNSGATMKALTRYGQDYASNEFGNAYNRLSNLAGIGQSSVNNLTNASGAYGQNLASIQTGMGNANAAANIAAANRSADVFGQVVSAVPTAIRYCDKRVKENIESVTQEDIKEFKSVISPYIFNYKGGSEKFIGPMAQDINRTKLGKLIIKEENGLLGIDIHKAVLLLLSLSGGIEND